MELHKLSCHGGGCSCCCNGGGCVCVCIGGSVGVCGGWFGTAAEAMTKASLMQALFIFQCMYSALL